MFWRLACAARWPWRWTGFPLDLLSQCRSIYRLICAYTNRSHVGQWCWWEFKDPAHLQSVDIGSTLIFFSGCHSASCTVGIPSISITNADGIFFFCLFRQRDSGVNRNSCEASKACNKNLSRVVCCTGKNKRYVGNTKTIMTTPTIITIETGKHLRWTLSALDLKRNDFDSTLRLCWMFLWPELSDLSKCIINPSSRA